MGLIFAALGLIAWYFTRHAFIAILFVIAVDMSGVALTLIKTWKEPGSETYTLWLILSFAALLSIFSVGEWSPAILLYPFYILFANLSVAFTKFVAEQKPKKVTP